MQSDCFGSVALFFSCCFDNSGFFSSFDKDLYFTHLIPVVQTVLKYLSIQIHITSCMTKTILIEVNSNTQTLSCLL